MPRMPQYQTQTYDARARKQKIIQIKDVNTNKDVTQEILNRYPSWSLTSSTGGTPNNTTPDISGQSSSSSTPPLTSHQEAEANVRAQFAAQVAAALRDTTEEKPRKPEYTIQRAPASIRAEIDVQGKASGSLTSSSSSITSSSASTPPLTSHQEAEANVRAQFAAQVAATLRDTTEEKPRKPEYTIHKAPASIRAEIDVQGKASGSLTSSSSSITSSSSSTPPLTSQHQAEANVRAQFAAQVAATLRDTTEEKPRKPEYTIQKAPASNRAEIDVQGKEAAGKSKNLFDSTATGNYQFFCLLFLSAWPQLFKGRITLSAG